MLLSFQEFFDIVVMTFLVGFLFKDAFGPVPVAKHKRGKEVDVLDKYMRSTKKSSKSWFGSDFWFAVGVIAPAIVLHEMAHKFVALGFGMDATFHAFYADPTTRFIGILAILAKLTGFGFVFLVPGFVRIIGSGTALEHFLIAFSGPLIHGLFWLGAFLLLRYKQDLSDRARRFIFLTKYINGFLFIINMLPIPGIDGFAVYSNLFRVFGWA